MAHQPKVEDTLHYVRSYTEDGEANISLISVEQFNDPDWTDKEVYGKGNWVGRVEKKNGMMRLFPDSDIMTTTPYEDWLKTELSGNDLKDIAKLDEEDAKSFG